MKYLYILLMIFMLIISCSTGKEDEVSAATAWNVAEKEALPVFTEAVREEAFVQGINASGLVEGLREARIISETSGLITNVYFEMGDAVEQGQVLLRVEDKMARISFDFALQDLKTAKLEFEGLEQSYKTGGSSLIQYNQGLTRLESARLRLEQAREVYDNTSIKAPFSGYIGSKASGINVGSHIQPGQLITNLVDSSEFQMRLSIGEDHITLVEEGALVDVFVNALPGEAFLASVSAVSPASQQGGGSFPILVRWKSDSPRLKSGMSASVRINPVIPGKSEILVPSSALVFRNGLSYVFRVKENAAEAVEVSILRSLGDRASVQSDLKAGDAVIVSGLSSLIPGDPVLPSPFPGEADA